MFMTEYIPPIRNGKYLKRVTTIMLGIVALFFSGYTSTVLWWLYYPYKPIVVRNIELSKEIVEQGEDFCFRFVGEKLLPVPAYVTIEIVVDRKGYIITEYAANNPTGTVFDWRCVIMPYHIPPGHQTFKWSGKYPVNPMRIIPEAFQREIIVTKAELKGRPGIPGRPGASVKGDKGDPGKGFWNK
jgi:hypothetical protein